MIPTPLIPPPQNPNIVPLPPHYSMLKESVDHFLTKYRNGVTDFCDFSSIFSRMLQSMADPPLGVVWFYSALGFHTTKLAVQIESSGRAAVAKDLFQLLVSCSDYCGSMKRIAILAPFVFELHRLVVEETDLKSEVQSLLEGLISYCSIFCGQGLQEDSDGMTSLDPSFLVVIPVWIVDQSGVWNHSKEFFPIISDQLREGIKSGCDIGFLAGIVMCEALLLNLCLEFESGIAKAEQEKKLHGVAVQNITGFRNFYFLDILSRMMLEPVLPVVNILGPENEVLLKEVLFNAVMTVEYSFINPQAGISLCPKSLKDFALTWLLSLTSQSSLLEWLLAVEDQGLSIFDGDTAKLRAKPKYFTSRTEYGPPIIKNSYYNVGKNLFLHSRHGGTEEDKPDTCDIDMDDPMDAMVLSADDRMSNSDTDGTRKRKECIADETKAKVKFMRCQFQENSMRENSIVFRQQ
ncbi:uncharacterized protein LOC114751598 [Neltuma alba]|uniref:uncharacterized protein LOC114751598 n=1 Tax=Neltuma alba TaxID=207710 RepID=UPI0010A46C15|nr:uncharacterized protein LOC114751598 [Prosopis alba]